MIYNNLKNPIEIIQEKDKGFGIIDYKQKKMYSNYTLLALIFYM